jgi:hypothetical protein
MVSFTPNDKVPEPYWKSARSTQQAEEVEAQGFSETSVNFYGTTRLHILPFSFLSREVVGFPKASGVCLETCIEII